MRRPPLTLLVPLLLVVLLLVLAPPAQARGGRSSARAPAAPPAAGSDRDMGSGQASACCGGGGQRPAPEVPDAVPGDVETPTLTGRPRRAPARPVGLGDWVYWYEANREEFEDLRKAALLTEANPLFALGGAIGERVGRPERRLAREAAAALRDAVREAVEPSREHWVYTEGAAYVALGKIATEPAEVEILIKALDEEAPHTEFVRESAILGLGQLRRTSARRQLDAGTLDRAREALDGVLADDRRPIRTRAFAAVSLGLLSDQPSQDAAVGSRTATRLLATWTSGELADETQIGLLIGLGLHQPQDVGSVARLALQACVLRGRVGSRSCTGAVRAHAALALGRIGTAADAAALVERLGERRDDSPMLRQAVTIAAGALGRRLEATRERLGTALVAARVAGKDPGSRDLAVLALGRILGAEVESGRALLLTRSKAGARLLASARDGSAQERSFAALALALAVRDVTERVDSFAWQELRVDALKALRAGLEDPRLDGHARAAFATALGLARDGHSLTPLKALVDERDEDPELRAYAALALGLVGEPREAVVKSLVAALGDARSDMLRMRATTALGLLGGGRRADREKTLAVLLEQLRVTRNQNVKGQIAITLARIGDERAVASLVALLEASKETHMTRAIACAALGLIGDEERTPVLSESRRDSHYMSGSSVVFDLLDVL